MIQRVSQLLFVAFSLFASKSQAQQVPVHMVSKGETLASIAQRYYGDPTREVVLQQENGLTASSGNALDAGMPVVVPTVFFYRAASGETWKAIAEQFYGSADRAFVLIEANRGGKSRQPDENAVLLIPYPVRHYAKAGETAAAIAKRYLGSGQKHVRWVRRFNGLKAARTQQQLILVPIADLKLSDEGQALLEVMASAKGSEKARVAQAEAVVRLPTLIEHVDKGGYAEAVALGNQLLGSGQLTETQEVTIYRALATAYVALDREDLAKNAFVAALKLQPNLELDTIKTSPRVLEALKKAREE